MALVVLLAAIYAACYAAIKAQLAFGPPLLLAGLRALVGGLVLLGALALFRRTLQPGSGSSRWIGALALTTTTLAFGAMFLSPGRTGAGIASVLGNLQPLMVLALAAPLLGERFTRRKGLALGLGASGVLLISSAALVGPDAYGLSGAFLALSASGGLAAGAILAKRMGPQPHLLALTAWQLLLGALPLLVGSVIVEQGASVAWTAESLGLLLFLAVPGTALPTPLWYWLVQRGDVGELSLILYLVPVFGLGLAIVMFGEATTPVEMLGAAFMVAAVLAVALPGPSARTPLPAT